MFGLSSKEGGRVGHHLLMGVWREGSCVCYHLSVAVVCSRDFYVISLFGWLFGWLVVCLFVWLIGWLVGWKKMANQTTNQRDHIKTPRKTVNPLVGWLENGPNNQPNNQPNSKNALFGCLVWLVGPEPT